MPTLQEPAVKELCERLIIEETSSIIVFRLGDHYGVWVITALFYAALHLVEMELAKNNVHSEDHVKRNNAVATVSRFKSIRSAYDVLCRESRKARYGCCSFNRDKAEQYRALFDHIEKELLKAS
ncbi:MAG TPA: hypothetical protein GX504_10150 [Clostridia bacterium]|nr:hypothetical protein [Clostridia bacterium]